MAYFVTGATGFIGRRLIEELLDHREGPVHLLCRPASLPRLRTLADRWGSERVVPVVGDLTAERLGVDPDWVSRHAGTVDHVFHLAAVYDMTAGEAANQAANVDGTRHAVGLAGALGAGCFHHVSSVAVAGDLRGRFDETMLDEGQGLPSPYHRTKLEAERAVRGQSTVPWRVYRPSVVVGDSVTGAIDKVDGPYYFFPLLKRLRDTLPPWLPLVAPDLGETNIVPVDYVAKALDHLAHLPGRDGETFHLVNPEPQPVLDVVNAFCAAAGAPRLDTPLGTPLARRLASGATRLLPASLQPAAVLDGALGGVFASAPARAVRDRAAGRLGIPPEVLEHAAFTATFDSRATERALAGSGIAVPVLETYAATLWRYWEEHLDGSPAGGR